jgi:hypothetical protein
VLRCHIRFALESKYRSAFFLKVRHHESVKIHSEDPTRGRVEGSEGGQVPEKYIVVRNNDLLHIRYRTDIIPNPLTSNDPKKFIFCFETFSKPVSVLDPMTYLRIQIRSSVCGTLSLWLVPYSDLKLKEADIDELKKFVNLP